MIVSDGVRGGAAYKTVISSDGATVNSGDGRRLTSLNRWSMIWDGHHFAPPDSGCVLYLPGHPGKGSTIIDYSRSFSDSGINTNEVLDISELHIDVDGDPTSVISTGDVIRIEDELMLVTSSAEPILVLRGYEGSHAATHTNTKDIYVRTKNDGSITGATWRQLPSGLSYLSYDGNNDLVNCGDIGTSIKTLEFWMDTDSTTESVLEEVDNTGVTINAGAMVYGSWDDCFVDGANTDTVTTAWRHVMITSTSNVDMSAFRIGLVDATFFQGELALVRAYTTQKVVANAQLHHAQERHLFNV